MITVKCSNCGKEGHLLFKGDDELRIPYNWVVVANQVWNTPEFELLCDEDGCWNKEDEE